MLVLVEVENTCGVNTVKTVQTRLIECGLHESIAPKKKLLLAQEIKKKRLARERKGKKKYVLWRKA